MKNYSGMREGSKYPAPSPSTMLFVRRGLLISHNSMQYSSTKPENVVILMDFFFLTGLNVPK